MSLTNCPMCRAPISTEGVNKSCEKCGADLTRWLPKPPRVSAISAVEAAAAEASGAAKLDVPNLERGILGAVAGAVAGLVVMYGFYLLTGFRFPLLGVGTGYLTGLLAKKLNQGGDEKLGMIAAGVAMVAVVGTLFLIYGSAMTDADILVLNCISVIVSASVAYRRASR